MICITLLYFENGFLFALWFCVRTTIIFWHYFDIIFMIYFSPFHFFDIVLHVIKMYYNHKNLWVGKVDFDIVNAKFNFFSSRKVLLLEKMSILISKLSITNARIMSYIDKLSTNIIFSFIELYFASLKIFIWNFTYDIKIPENFEISANVEYMLQKNHK